jgi:DNA-binding XRE family transcriptional regulator
MAELCKKKMVKTITAEHVRAARGLLKWTQEELAQRANVTATTINNWENERPFPVKRHAPWCAMRSRASESLSPTVGIPACD